MRRINSFKIDGLGCRKVNRLFSFINFLYFSEPAKDPFNVSNSALPDPVKLKFDLNQSLVNAISKAEQAAICLISDSDALVLVYEEYGSDEIRKITGGLSPVSLTVKFFDDALGRFCSNGITTCIL